MARFADRMADAAKAGSLLRSPLTAGFKTRKTPDGATWSEPWCHRRHPARASTLLGASPGLHAMFERLAALKPDGALCGMTMPGGPQPAVAVPDGARFEEFTLQGSGGTLGYKLYVPSGFVGPDRPLVVMLHGCTQSPDDFAAGTRMNEIAEEQNLLVAYPRQTSSGNAQKCWNWFEAKDQRRDGGEPALIAGLTRRIMQDFPVDPTARLRGWACRRVGPRPPSWRRPTRTFTPRRASIPVSRPAPPPTWCRPSPPCGRAARHAREA